MNSHPLGELLGDIRLQEFCFMTLKAMGLIVTCIKVCLFCLPWERPSEPLPVLVLVLGECPLGHMLIYVFTNGLFSHMSVGMIAAKSPCPGELVHVMLWEVSSEAAHGRPGLHSTLVYLHKLYIPATGWFALNIAKFFFIMFKNSFRNWRNVGAFLRSQLFEAEFKVG